MIHLESMTLTVVWWLAGAALAAWLAFPTSARLQAERERFVKETGAYLDPAFFDAFDVRTRRNFRMRALSVLILVTGTLIVLRLTAINPSLIAAPLLGVALALESWDRLQDAGREFQVPGHRTAVARPRRVVLADYVSAPTRFLTWASMSIVVISTSAVIVDRREVGATVTAVVATGAASILAVAVFTAWFSRALCERPSPAVDASHLYLQDAWRAAALGRVHFLLRLSAVLFALAALASSTKLGLVLSEALLLASVAIMTGSFLIRGRHFRTRLWPTLPPGQFLLPGQTMPLQAGAPA